MNASRKTILIIEDDASIREGLTDAIQSDGYRALTAADGQDGLRQFEAESVDLILLDIMLPAINGYDVCRRIREKDKRVPILMLTAKTEEIDQVLGLELGADDYVAKPFRIRELLARIHAAFRRVEAHRNISETNTDSSFQFGEALIDRKRYIATVDGAERQLSEKELRLLEVLSEHPQEALSRNFLLDKVWGIDYMGTTRTLDQHIAKLRSKIESKGAPQSIVTVHGIGYKYSG